MQNTKQELFLKKKITQDSKAQWKWVFFIIIYLFIIERMVIFHGLKLLGKIH